MKITAPPGNPPAASGASTGTAAGGDLSGTYPSPNVVKLGGITVDTLSAVDGYALIFVATNADIEFGTLSVNAVSGHWEMLVQDGVTAPPVGLENEARDDFLFGIVSG